MMNEAIWTPDGLVALSVWHAILEVENHSSYSIKENYKFTREHLQSKYYQKMNVALAFQFFGIADTLEVFQNEHPELENCEAGKNFCQRIKALIDAMNSRHAYAGMAPNNKAYNAIKDFLEYLENWKSCAVLKGYEFMPESTYYGLKISLQASFELCEYLSSNCGFSYLLTAHLNQDALERFFGMMRESCGANDHPDSHLFIQMYRLISTYSLVEPPRGSNVSNKDIFDVLLQIKDIDDAEQRTGQWHAQLDTILDRGCTEMFVEATALEKEHDYSHSEVSTYAITYIAGYVSRKAGNRFAKFVSSEKQSTCNDCINISVVTG